ncbi:Cys-tRNA(Pro) deacylase [Campylobacter sp. RM9344]|uniref:Cys-tRNA(Pro)/Cys-tRNA(Cys) deacylase n=1 Tax=Campylobacter californiensis TaxID=1032243 RepID=A0AAW3ZY26_9BACT|nr:MULTISPECIES: Cys-tRNA(Pro) deacylase [unclassified Campylobacter]MBE2985048.1 Cys-tRNA(Pro) deacylase [Campylobacter sp. RM6883]MBE2986618.1 Cys-tRNA(Pro) deacylase [Campylobacter sp. RM12919]MBE2987588.1 Cys-tRNA(Pro) deacylase [Campylobacter sp. RM12920]MBE2995628.1 Cys-tRNA(Pro) deacylase [Campylobacter sp. RM6913]MBE3029211.1 Cys-tRNA(Pro) deacylase [Campylobacter sp. RM9344]
MIHKTNAARILDKFKIPYKIIEYEVDESDLSAVHVANVAAQPIEKIYKTIVCVCEPKNYIIACIQGDLELNLKSLAQAAGVKRCELVNLRDLEKITGYIRGGCSPIGMKKQFATFIDDRAINLQEIYISAGVRGKQLMLNPLDLAKICDAKFQSIARSARE